MYNSRGEKSCGPPSLERSSQNLAVISYRQHQQVFIYGCVWHPRLLITSFSECSTSSFNLKHLLYPKYSLLHSPQYLAAHLYLPLAYMLRW